MCETPEMHENIVAKDTLIERAHSRIDVEMSKRRMVCAGHTQFRHESLRVIELVTVWHFNDNFLLRLEEVGDHVKRQTGAIDESDAAK
jgi:hypothetical protein